MRLSKYTDYGIRVLIYLSNNHENLSTTREISNYYKISYNHLTKVVYNLGKANLIQTIKGRGGGHRLNSQNEKLTLGKVVRTLESDFNLVECFDKANKTCQVLPHCKVKKHLSVALEAYFSELDKIDITEFSRSFKVS